MVGAFIGYGVLTASAARRVLDPDRAAPVHHVRRVDARRRPPRRRDRAFAYRPPARRPANRAADHGARRLLLPRERGLLLSAPTTAATTPSSWKAASLVDRDRAPGRRPPGAGADHRRSSGRSS